MKTLVLLAFAGLIAGCTTQKEIQMNVEVVELVKIDTVNRYANVTEQVLTWRSADHVDYVTFEPLSSAYALGTKMRVMMKR